MQLLKVLFFYVFCCLCCSVYTQENTKRISLIKLIAQLEGAHNIQFNYLESNVKKQVFFNSELSLANLLLSLEKQTQLRFEVVDNTQVIIRKLKDTDLVSVCGYIAINDVSKEEITIIDTLSETTVYADDKGFFELKNIPYGSTIVCKRDAVFLRKISVAHLFKPECVNIKLSLLSEKLEEIVITSYLTGGITKEAQKIQIQPNKFTMLPGLTEPDVMKSLEHIPSVQSPFEMASRLYIRGSTPDQNLILWNGIKTYNSSHFFGLISAFNPYSIEKIDFYDKGVQSKYGDRLAGVIDMKSTTKVHNEFSGGVGVNLIQGDAFVNVPVLKDKLSFTLSARRSYTDFLKTPTYTSMATRVFQNTRLNEGIASANSNFYFLDYSLGIQAVLTKKDALQFNMLYAKNKLAFKNDAELNSYSDDLITKNEGYSVQWQHQYSDDLKQNTTINLSNYSLDYLFETSNTSGEANEIKKNFVNDYGVKTTLNWNFNKNTDLQFGYQYSANNVRYEVKNTTDNFSITLGEQKNTLQTHSLFTEYEVSFSDKAMVQLGLRGNKYSTSSQLFVEPRLYAELEVLPNFTLNNTVTFTSQAVTQIEESVINSVALEELLWRITDDTEFNILTSQQYSLGATYKNKSWFIEGDGFYKHTNNVTTLTAGFLNPLNNDFSIGKSKTLGAELFVKKKFKNYSSWVSYTFTNQESKFDLVNDNDYFISNLNIEHTFKWQHYYKLNNFQFSLGWLWHSGIATTNVIGIKEEGKPVTLMYDNLNNENLPVYHKLDFSVLYNFKQKEAKRVRYQAGLSIQNIYNRKSILNREFVTTPGLDNELQIIDYNSLGFTPNISLRMFW